MAGKKCEACHATLWEIDWVHTRGGGGLAYKSDGYTRRKIKIKPPGETNLGLVSFEGEREGEVWARFWSRAPIPFPFLFERLPHRLPF